MNQEKRRGTPRARITEIDALYIAFASKFPAAEAEAFSVLRHRNATPLHGNTPELTSIRTTETRLKKIVKLKMMNAFRNPATGITSYGATELGWEVAQEFGYELSTYSGISGISLERLNHFRLIAHVAAQMISPSDFHGLGTVTIDDVISENEMRAAYERTQRKHKNVEGYTFPSWREQAFKKAVQLVGEDRFSLADLVQKEPALLTVGHSKGTPSGIKYKQLHQADFALVLDKTLREKKGKAKNILVEVELSRKSWEAYEQILATLTRELSTNAVYEKCIYFTIGNGIGNMLKKIDAAGEYGLFKSGKLEVRELTRRDGTPVKANRRVKVEA